MGISHVVRRLGLKRVGGNWWITDLPIYYADGEGPFTECGPYDTRESAESDRKGMQVTLDKVGFEDEEPPKEVVRRKEPSRKKTIVERKEEAKTFVEEEGLW